MSLDGIARRPTTRAAVVLALAAAATAAAPARPAIADDDGGDLVYACTPVAPTAKLTATFKPEVSVAELAVWVAGFTCEAVVIAPDVARHATRVQIIAPAPMTPKQAIKLFVASLEAAGLRVRRKDRTFTVTLGPGMPRTCPDLAVGESGEPLTGAPPLDVDVLAGRLAAQIRTIDATHTEVPRRLVDDVLANPTAFARGARVLPAITDGVITGFKIYAVKPGGVYARLGLVNGDVVTAIAGRPVDTMDRALEAYAALRTASGVEVAVLRRGKPVTLTVTFVP